MKAGLFALTSVMLVACVVPFGFAQPGTIFNYTIHVDFLAYSCSLNVNQISLFGSSGNLVGEGTSPYGGEVEISVITPSPITTLTATASGLATLGSYYTWPVDGTRSIPLGNTGDYWVTITMN